MLKIKIQTMNVISSEERVSKNLRDSVDANENIEIYTNETNVAHVVIGGKYINTYKFIDEAYQLIDRVLKAGEKMMMDISMERIRNR